MTLVDVSAVSKALHGLDIGPVAAALGHATEPEMGAASTRYGQLLADEIHHAAIESTGRMITGLVQSGMPWPTAIDRASRVHGVPADRLGKAGVALRAPVMAPLAADDISDRALMEYASHVGSRESAAQGVSKAERERFREEEVVRDEKGRFADEDQKGSLVALSRDGLDAAAERQRKRDKQNKVQRVRARRKALSAQREARKPKEITLADLARVNRQGKESSGQGPARERAAGDPDEMRAAARAEAKADRLAAAKDARKADRRAAAKAQRIKDTKARLLAALRNRKPAGGGEEFGDLTENPVKPNGAGLYPGHVIGSRGQQKFMILDAKLAEAAVKQGGFNFGTISASQFFYASNGDEPLDREQLRDYILEYSFEPEGNEGGDTFLDGLAIVVFDGEMAYSEGFTGTYSENLSNAGTYKMEEPREGSKRALSYSDDFDLKLRAYSDPGSPTSEKVDIELPHFVVRLDNAKAFDDSVGKAWDESLVERDEDGRFAEENRRVLTPEEKAAKRAKLMKRRKRMAGIREKRAASRPREITVADLARAGNQNRPAAQGSPRRKAEESAEQGGEDAQVLRQRRTAEGRAERLAEAKDRRREQRRSDSKAARRERAVASLAARVAEMDEVRDEHHEEWKHLDALTFDRESAHGSFIDLFGFDPYNGREIAGGRAVHGVDEHQDTIDYQMSRVKPVTVVAGAMHTRPPDDAFGDEMEAWDPEGPREVHEHFFNAWAAADLVAQEMNENKPSDRKAWKPFTKKDSITGMFEPWVAEVYKVDEHVVVLGSKSDWRAVRNGADVKLEPLAGFNKDSDHPGQGMFDTLFDAVSDAGDYGSYSGTAGRSDYYIRAFRIKT